MSRAVIYARTSRGINSASVLWSPGSLNLHSVQWKICPCFVKWMYAPWCSYTWTHNGDCFKFSAKLSCTRKRSARERLWWFALWAKWINDLPRCNTMSCLPLLSFPVPFEVVFSLILRVLQWSRCNRFWHALWRWSSRWKKWWPIAKSCLSLRLEIRLEVHEKTYQAGNVASFCFLPLLRRRHDWIRMRKPDHNQTHWR